MRSRTLVNKVQRALGLRGVGHAGTLDAPATGVMLILCGHATRLTEALMSCSKRYRTTLRFGLETDSLDATGIATQHAPLPTGVDAKALLAQCEAWRGRYAQRPPTISALRVDGQRAHAQQRAGKTPVLAARDVTLYETQLLALSTRGAAFDIDVGRGFYVRAFARDVAECLGTVGHLSHLSRRRVGRWAAADTFPGALLNREVPTAALREALLTRFWSLDRLAAAFPQQRLAAEDVKRFAYGAFSPLPQGDVCEGWHAIVSPEGSLLAVGEVREGRWCSLRRLPTPVEMWPGA